MGKVKKKEAKAVEKLLNENLAQGLRELDELAGKDPAKANDIITKFIETKKESITTWQKFALENSQGQYENLLIQVRGEEVLIAARNKKKAEAEPKPPKSNTVLIGTTRVDKKLIVVGVAALLLIAGIAAFVLIKDNAEKNKVVGISTVDEIKTMNGSTNYCLNQDLDLSDVEWTSINYDRTFDGNGHTITGLKEPLFNVLKGKVENLTVTDVDIQGTNVAPIALQNNGTIVNVKVTGKVVTSGTAYCGGIVAESSGPITDCTSEVVITGTAPSGGIAGHTTSDIIGCVNKGTITVSTSFVGGIVGTASSTIQNCRNEASITATNVVGGIAGYADGSTGCTNNGAIKATGNNTNGDAEVGGICGSTCNVKDCTNSGTVESAGIGAKRAGGIAGTLQRVTKLSGLKNNGAVTCKGENVGGLIAYYVIGSKISATMTDCENNAKITGNSDNVGGLIGRVDTGSGSSFTISNSRNSASVTGIGFVGGFVGLGNGTVLNGLTIGVAVTGSYNVGGLAGQAERAENCQNTGNITATGKNGSGEVLAGGICGACATVTTSTNTGTITSSGSDATMIGGIAGKVWGPGDIDGLINNGAINSSGDYTGGLIGYYYLYGRGLVRNLTNSSNTHNIVSTNSYVGGLIGCVQMSRPYSSDTMPRLKIDTSTNTGDITGKIYVGGYVGVGNYTDISNAANANAITGEYNVGGIAGHASTLTNCTNSGTITGTGRDMDNKSHIGGIVGDCNTVTKSSNSGTVSSTGVNGTRVGGIAGLVSGPADMTELENTGSVSSDGDYLGGLFGYYYLYGNGLVRNLTNSSNTHNIVSTNSYVGGLIGCVQMSRPYSSDTMPRLVIRDCTDSYSTTVGGGTNYTIE